MSNDNSLEYTTDEMMTVAAARALDDKVVCFVGIGLPSTAANLARRMHAPDAVLIYESGCIGSRPIRLPASVGDGVLAEYADAVIGVPEIFSYWLQAGRVDVGFLGAAQIDKFSNLNTTVIGPYDKPITRLPGAGGAPEIAANAGAIIITLRHSTRAFVGKLDFVTSMGYGTGAGDRERYGLRGGGPIAVITDLGILTPDPITKELVLTSIHPGATVEQVKAATGWDLLVSEALIETKAPTAEELKVLRDLKAA